MSEREAIVRMIPQGTLERGKGDCMISDQCRVVRGQEKNIGSWKMPCF